MLTWENKSLHFLFDPFMIMTNYRYNLSLDIKLQIPSTSEEKDKSTEHNSEDTLHQKDEIISYQTAEMIKFYKYENIKF